jgi:hypothetical protein
MRNYAILHISVDEAKVFQTKERAPLLLCLEAYRPEELQLEQANTESIKADHNSYLPPVQKENPYI